MNTNGNRVYFRFSEWLPRQLEIDGQIVHLDDDLSGWVEHFKQRGIKTELRVKGEQVALFVEGDDAFKDGED